MTFWDSSAVVPLIIRQPMTELAEQHLRVDARMVVWWGSHVECVSALRRLERERHLTSKELEETLATIGLLSAHWIEILPHHDVRRLAEQLLARHSLRAADALQLAAALTWAGPSPTGFFFASFDERLTDAAAREGLAAPSGWWR